VDARRAVRRGVEDLDADRQRVRDLAVSRGRRQRREPHEGRQGAGARAARPGPAEQRPGRRVRARRALSVVRPPPGRLRLQPGPAGVGARHLRPADRQSVQPDRSVRQRDASGALAGRPVARVRDAPRCGNGAAAAQPVVGRRAVARLPRATRRPGVALHPRPDARIVLHPRLEGAGRVVRREAVARRGAVGSGGAHSVHGERAPGPGAAGPVPDPRGYGRRAREADPGREPLARREAPGVQRARQAVRDGSAGRHASPPDGRQRARAGTGVVARRAVDRLRHVDRPGRACPEDPRGRPRQRAAAHARPRLLRSPRVVARRAAHRGDQGAARPPSGGALRARLRARLAACGGRRAHARHADCGRRPAPVQPGPESDLHLRGQRRPRLAALRRHRPSGPHQGHGVHAQLSAQPGAVSRG